LLGLGGVTGASKVWLDGKPAPELNNPVSAVGIQADLTDRLQPGEHALTVYAGPRNPKSDYEHQSIPNAGMQMISSLWRFRGVWRGVEAVAVDPLHLLDFHVMGDPKARTFRVKARLSQAVPDGCALVLRASRCDGKKPLGEARAAIAAGRCAAEATVAVPELGPWSHRSPELALIEVVLEREGVPVDVLVERCGLRSLALRNPTEETADGILVNGIPTFFAGEMHTCRCPDTISPFIDRAALRKRLQAFKDAGFTYLRMHTTVAHPEMLDVCDELGLYIQTETITVRHGGESVQGGGWKEGDDPLNNLGVRIWRDTLLRDRNHPSLISVSMTNEGSGRQEKNTKVLQKKYEYCARLAYELDGTRFYVDSSPGYVLLPRETVGPHFPIEHEPGRMASYPDPAVLAAHPDLKDTWHIAWVGARLEKAGLAKWWPRFAASSQRLQARCVAALYQRSRLHNPNYCGGEHSTVFDAHAWMWGVLDDWGNPKSPPAFMEEIRATMADTAVLLSGLGLDSANVTSGGTRNFTPSISHYGGQRLEDAELELSVEGKRVGEWRNISAECGTLAKLTSCQWTAPAVEAPRRLAVQAVLRAGGQVIARQHWRSWVFPPPAKTPLALDLQMKEQAAFHAQTVKTLEGLAVGGQTKVLVTDDAAEADQGLARGGRVVLLVGPSKSKKGEKEVGFKDGDKEVVHPYWNYVGQPGCPSDWAPGRPIHGHHFTVIEPHPILEGLPHEGWAEECFWRAARTRGIGHTPRAPFGNGWSARSDIVPGLVPVIATVPGQIETRPCLGAWVAVKQHDSGGRLAMCTLDLTESDPLGAWLAGRILGWIKGGAG
jgi:hypothetical protein